MSCDIGQAYNDGLWDMFEQISSAYHGKQYYFLQEDGNVYSRECHKEISFDEAINEFLERIG